MASQISHAKAPMGIYWVWRFLKQYPELKPYRNKSMEADRWKAKNIDILNLFFSEINDLIK